MEKTGCVPRSFTADMIDASQMERRFPRVLFLYSNPPRTKRLRLDKEHRAIERVLEELGVDQGYARRLHASTVGDLTKALQTGDYDVLHFSGHGSAEGILLESSDSKTAVLLTAEKISKALSSVVPGPKAAVFISCFSASTVTKLIGAVPYLVTVAGQADDEAAIRFVEAFYRSYFGAGSVDKAFQNGLLELEIADLTPLIRPVLSRRALETGPGHMVFQVFPWGKGESLLVDVTEAQASMKQLGVEPDELFQLLTRKMRVGLAPISETNS